LDHPKKADLVKKNKENAGSEYRQLFFPEITYGTLWT